MKMNLLAAVAILCAVFLTTKGQNIKLGTCAAVNAKPVSPFNIAQYAGMWYEISRYEQIFQKSGDCVTATYAPAGTNNYTVTNQMVNLENRTRLSVQGYAQLANATANPQEGLLTVTFNEGAKTTAEYRVLHTDYNSYAIVYSCRTLNMTHIAESAWVLSRQRTLSAALKTIVNNQLVSSPIDSTKLRKTEQDNYICTINTACSKLQAPVVENFDTSKYLGQWYEISRYEKNFQSGGDCVTANYAINTGAAGGLTVNNHMITLNNRAVKSANGFANLADASGDPLLGILNVSFNTTGVPTDAEYRVMATDYTSFAIVYNCHNNAGATSYDSAWILSRQRTFSAETEKYVNQLLSLSKITVSKLRKTEQDNYICSTSTACSRTDAPVVQNFDATRYLGEWYEISRHEKQTFQSGGDCVTANYSPNALGGLKVNNTMKNLTNRTVKSVLGTAVLANAAGNPVLGFLKVSFNESGVPTDSEYRILATDYTTYSVVYSCKNILGTKTYGSAWVLSRNRTLANTSEAYTQIDSVNYAINKTLMRITEQDPLKCNACAILAPITVLFIAFTFGQFFTM